MTDPMEQWNTAVKAGLVGSREGNRKRMGASPPEGTPKARKMFELGFPSNFWLPLKAVEAWRTDDYPAQPTIESIRIWLVLKDAQLRFDFRDFGYVDVKERLRIANRHDTQLIRRYARKLWDKAIDCPEAKNLPSVLPGPDLTNSKNGTEQGSKPRLASMKSCEANRRVAEKLAQTKGKISQRELSAQITNESKLNCSTGLIAETTAWKAFQDEKKRRRGPAAPRAVPLTNKLLNVQAAKEETLAALIREQGDDHEPSPLDPSPAKPRPRRKTL